MCVRFLSLHASTKNDGMLMERKSLKKIRLESVKGEKEFKITSPAQNPFHITYTLKEIF